MYTKLYKKNITNVYILLSSLSMLYMSDINICQQFILFHCVSQNKRLSANYKNNTDIVINVFR